MPHARIRLFGQPGHTDIAYTERGTGSVPLVLYPPLGHSRSLYNDLMRRLGDDVRCISIDPPGVGDSDTPAFGAYTVQQEVDTLRNVLIALGIKKAVIAGVSRGATVALAFALRYPEMTLGVITQGPVINSDDFPEIEKFAVTGLVDLGERIASKKPLWRRILTGWPISVAYALHVPPYKEMALLELRDPKNRKRAKRLFAEARESMRVVPTNATYRMLQDLMQNIHLEQQLSTLEVPLLLMDGENVTAAAGAYKPIASLERIEAAVDPKLVTRKIISGTGHLAMFIEANVVAETIVDFINTLPASEVE